MARARTRTKLALDEWARIMGISPLHFNQCYIPNQELNTICSSSFFQYDWQDSDRVSREQLADAIRQAEQNIEAFLGYHLMPTWDADEQHGIMARPYRPENFNLSQTDVRGLPTGVQCDFGYFQTGGIEAKSVVSQNESISWSDADGDSLDDTGTVTFFSTLAAEEIELFYPGHAGDPAWQIRPVTTVVAAGTATCTFRRELALLEAKIEEMGDPRGQDYTSDGNFLSAVDVYRHYNDPQVQAIMLWEVPGSCATGRCQYTEQPACLLGRYNARLGFVSFQPVGDWDPNTSQFEPASSAVGREADAIRLWYRSGWRGATMDQDLAYIVAIYAASMLDRKVCDCKGISDGILRWQQDLAFAGGATELSSSQIGDFVLNSQFGTRAGAVEAYRRLWLRGPISKPVLA